MSQETLVAGAAYSAAAATVYLVVGVILWRRRLSPEFELAGSMFSVWWLALGTTSALTASLTVAGALGGPPFFVVLALTYFNLWLVCMGLAGLLYYLVYLFTGLRRTVIPIAVFYVVVFALIVYALNAAGPTGVSIDEWSVGLEYGQELPRMVGLLLLGLLVLPQIVAGLFYLSLVRQASSSTQKYRVVMVGTAILVWFGVGIVASLAGISTERWWQFVSRLIGLAAATATLMAYEPPAWVRRWLGVESIRVSAQTS